MTKQIYGKMEPTAHYIMLFPNTTSFSRPSVFVEYYVARRWIALDIPSLSSQSDRAKNNIHCFSIH